MNLIQKCNSKIISLYKKSSLWMKVLIIVSVLLLVAMVYNRHKPRIEGFTQQEKFIAKKGSQVYDKFYVDLYDDLIFDAAKNKFEITEIMRATNMNPKTSVVLDIGSGCGHHVKLLSSKGCDVVGLDKSKEMISKAKTKYPGLTFEEGDAMTAMKYPAGSFTTIICLYFTIYCIQDKRTFFQNCYNWLNPGGYLAIHLVNRDKFDPILNIADPLTMVSAQKYAKERITNSVVKFNNFQYKADFKLNKERNEAEFDETFKDDTTGKVRKNTHTLYMPTQKSIIAMAKTAGFTLKGKIDMVGCQYEYQYIYILHKPK